MPLLRPALAAGPNRRVVEAVLAHVWQGGGEANDPARLAALREQLAPARDQLSPGGAVADKKAGPRADRGPARGRARQVP